MASVYKAEKSPFWQCKGVGFEGKKLWLSTKLTNKGQAEHVSRIWEQACRDAEKQQLNPAKADKIVEQVKDYTGNYKTRDITRDLMDDILKEMGCDTSNFRKFCEDWLVKRETQTSKATFNKYTVTVNRFLGSLGEKRCKGPVSSIKPLDVQRFIDAELERGMSSSTARLSRTILAGLFSKAIANQLIVFNPANPKSVEVPREDPDERIPFETHHVRAMYEVASLEWKGMLLVGYQAGLRISDAANLTWENIDLERRVLSYTPEKTKNSKNKAKRDMAVTLHRDLINYLTALPSSDDPQAPLFPNLYGKETNGRSGLSKRFSKLMLKAGIEQMWGREKHGSGRRFPLLTFHSLRHGIVTRLTTAGIEPNIRMKIVGHSSPAVHSGYSHVVAPVIASAVDLLDSVLS